MNTSVYILFGIQIFVKSKKEKEKYYYYKAEWNEFSYIWNVGLNKIHIKSLLCPMQMYII